MWLRLKLFSQQILIALRNRIELASVICDRFESALNFCVSPTYCMAWIDNLHTYFQFYYIAIVALETVLEFGALNGISTLDLARCELRRLDVAVAQSFTISIGSCRSGIENNNNKTREFSASFSCPIMANTKVIVGRIISWLTFAEIMGRNSREIPLRIESCSRSGTWLTIIDRDSSFRSANSFKCRCSITNHQKTTSKQSYLGKIYTKSFESSTASWYVKDLFYFDTLIIVFVWILLVYWTKYQSKMMAEKQLQCDTMQYYLYAFCSFPLYDNIIYFIRMLSIICYGYCYRWLINSYNSKTTLLLIFVSWHTIINYFTRERIKFSSII